MYYLSGMKKLTLLVVLTIGMIGSTFAQMAIPGEVFASNPQRFNGRKVTIKNIVLVDSVAVSTTNITQPLNGPIHIGPAPSNPQRQLPCRPPRGFSEIYVFFKAAPDYSACFFMADNMREQLHRELGREGVDAKITFRGDYRTGYVISFYRLGN